MIDIGSKINGRYKVIGNVGSGGMANVFLAHDLILDRDVAVKVLRFDFQDDQSAIRRFQREALAASELVHPSIVGVYDVGEEDGRQYLVMEYVRGTDLKKYIANNFPIPLENIVIIMRQILSGISLAHQHRIIHRDLKPQNILMDEDGNVKIADFGIAIALSETSLTQTNTLLGSVHYLSPEQARGSMATRQSDIYALGIILYELLTGRVPFEGESAVSIALKHFQTDVPSVRAVDPEIPQALENVVLHATAKEATDRYISADEMAEDIATALSPSREYEAPFEPRAMMEETKVLTPITEEEMPEAFKHLPTPPVETEESADTAIAATPKKKRIRKRWYFIATFVVLVAGVLAFLAFYRPTEIKVPDVTGKTVTEAISIIEEAKLTVEREVIEMPNKDYPKGQVFKTNPDIGTMMKKNKPVQLYVSSGNETIEMLNLVGWQSKDALQELLNNGFKKSQIKEQTQKSEDVPEGEVISQTPDAGEDVDPLNDQVTLVISSGRGEFRINSLVGQTQADAENYLIENGLNPVLVEANSETVLAGHVISHSPSAGSTMTTGGVVTLTISIGPKAKPPVSPPVTPPTTSSSDASGGSSGNTSSSESSEPEEATDATEESSPKDDDSPS